MSNKQLSLNEMFAIIKKANEKMHGVDGLSEIPHLTLEVTNTGIDGRDVEGRILFSGGQIWDSIEDSSDPNEIREVIAEEILEMERNLSLIAGRIKELVGKQEW